jgi:hypothetical protein
MRGRLLTIRPRVVEPVGEGRLLTDWVAHDDAMRCDAMSPASVFRAAIPVAVLTTTLPVPLSDIKIPYELRFSQPALLYHPRRPVLTISTTGLRKVACLAALQPSG